MCLGWPVRRGKRCRRRSPVAFRSGGAFEDDQQVVLNDLQMFSVWTADHPPPLASARAELARAAYNGDTAQA
jgi:hypothetical protein